MSRGAGGPLNHYERLGVAVDAEVAVIRAAYLRAARRVHPDVAGGDPAAGAEMVAINEAWAELSDVVRRQRYDLTLSELDRPATGQEGPSTVVRPSAGTGFRPLDDDDPDDSFRYSEDEGDPSTATGGALVMVPAVLVGIAAVAGVLSMALDSGALARLALVALVGCLLSAVAIPMVVMGRAVRHEGRSRRT